MGICQRKKISRTEGRGMVTQGIQILSCHQKGEGFEGDRAAQNSKDQAIQCLGSVVFTLT